MKTHLQEEPAPAPAPENLPDVSPLEKYGFVPFYLDETPSLRRRTVYEVSRAFRERMERVVENWKEAPDHPLKHEQAVEQLMFFDTETTGLSTGAGTFIFLIGYARLTGDGLEVTQHFLEGPEKEAPFLGGFLDDFQASDVIVSYNGKSFDWPQVKSRHQFLRRELPRLPESGHIDLLHAARRFWKHELPSCRLAVIEEHVLRKPRTNDTPGALAPLLYFDYMETGKTEELTGIFDHHDQDVRTLMELYVLLSEKVLQLDTLRSADHAAAAHWWEKAGSPAHAEDHWRQAFEADPRSSYRLRYAMMLQKRKKKQEALALLLPCLQDRSPSPEVMDELAKLLEHEEKDSERALRAVQRGLDAAPDSRTMAKLRKRADRLQKKTGGLGL
ncbi:ribonuclease H-like domain-containing protein [Alkalicoccus chagannorensis]|uniref:ribonuclease H-like domain-containing protein n=1 Tax=Alkalicoccus chagannorensis TaxID=427072 RepID=UPI0012EB8215|nr:ribonuclease H-like domain-containing protein [Alkalicoccus chagannorensis]